MVNEIYESGRGKTSSLKNKVLAVIGGIILSTGCRGLKYNSNWLNETQINYRSYEDSRIPNNLFESEENYMRIRTGAIFKQSH